MTQSPRFSRALSFALVGLFLTALSRAVAADATPRMFDLPSDTAEHALKQFSEQTKLEVLIGTKVGREVKTNAVKGEMSPRAALDAMLAGTGLVIFQDEKSGGLVVRRENTDESKNVSRAIAESSDRPNRRSRVTQNESGEDVVKLDTFEVFERKTLNMDIRRTRDDVQPYVVLDRKEIELSGASSLEDFLRLKVPMNSQSSSLAQTGTAIPNNQSQINLRGMGTNQTLVLVDGRRMPSVNINSGQLAGGSFASFSLAQPDINGIPLAAIERIEILPSTAGGIYGGGATGGVVNIITRRNYTGIDLSATYGSGFDGAAAFNEVSLLAGVTVNGGKTRVSLNATRKDVDPLLNSDRNFALRLRQNTLTTNPPAANAIPPNGYTTNFRSVNLQPLVLDNGTPLNSIYASIPVGYAGVASDGGAALVARAGIYSQAPSDDTNSSGLRRSILNSPMITSLGASLRQEVSERLELFFDIARNENLGRIRSSVTAGNLNRITSLAAGAPNNPFLQAITIVFPTPTLSAANSWTKSTTTRWQAGFIANLIHSWKVEGDFAHSTSELESVFHSGNVLSSAGTTSLSNGSLDVMKDLNVFPIDYSPYFRSDIGQHHGPFKTTATDGTLRFSSPPFSFPVADFSLSGSLERRKEEAAPSFTNAITATSQNAVFLPRRSQRVDSGYVEIQGVPNPASSVPDIFKSLRLQLSARRDKYTTETALPYTTGLATRSSDLPSLTTFRGNANATAYTAGLQWAPTSLFVLRASFGTGVLPPGANQVGTDTALTPFADISPATDEIVFGHDPKRGNTVIGLDAAGNPVPGDFSQKSFGNTTLTPEKSESTSIGVVLTPRQVSGLRVSFDYTRIRKKDEIVTLQIPQIVALEDQFPGRITRGASLPGDLPGWAGPITGVDTTPVNLAASLIEALDVQFDYEIKTTSAGTITLSAIGTRQFHQQQRILKNSGVIEYVDSEPGPLKFKGNAGITWKYGRWSVGWNMQYYSDYSIFVPTDDQPTRVSKVAAQGSSRIPAQRFHDLFLQYKHHGGSRWLGRDLSATLAVQNVFDTIPEYRATLIGYSFYGDPRLRRFTLTIRKSL